MYYRITLCRLLLWLLLLGMYIKSKCNEMCKGKSAHVILMAQRCCIKQDQTTSQVRRTAGHYAGQMHLKSSWGNVLHHDDLLSMCESLGSTWLFSFIQLPTALRDLLMFYGLFFPFYYNISTQNNVIRPVKGSNFSTSQIQHNKTQPLCCFGNRM